MAAFFSVGMFAAGTATTVYYTAGADVIGTYTVKLNVHMGCDDGDDWKQYDMSKTDKTYGSDPIYKAEFTDYWNGLCTIQFQLYDGSTWKSQDEVFNGSWHVVDGYNGKMYVHSSKEWVEADSQPGDCTIGSQPFLGCDGGASAYANTFKVCAPTGVNVVNVQTPGGKEPSIYVNFPAAPITACSLGEGNYDVQGAGLFLHCAAFVQELTDVTVIANNVEYAIKVYRKPNYYLTGTAAFGSWNLSKALPFFGDSIVVDLAVGEHQFKVLPQNDKWDGAMGYAAVNAECSSEGITEGENSNIVVELKEKADIKIKVVEGKLCITGPFAVPAAPTLVNGFYLIGQKGWAVADLSAELLFTANPDKENEYQLNVTLKEDEGIKVVKVENDVIKTWYPDGEGNEYKVDKNHAGAKTIYFQELYNEAWKDFGGHIYIEANPADGISNMTNGMNAQKFIENGQLFIRVNGTIYSVVGQAK